MQCLLPILPREDADVGSVRASYQGVSRDVHELLARALHRLLPDNTIGAQGVHQPLCHLELGLALLCLVHDRFLLRHGLGELPHQLRQLRLQCRHHGLDRRQLCVRIVERLRGLPESLSLRLHLRDDVVVHDDVDDEDAEARSRPRLLHHAGLREVVAHALPDLPGFLNIGLRHIAFVDLLFVIFQVLQELLGSVHHLLRALP
mmetsp:Transcript_52741/g.171535  ORF Transcript_52741/g.171535 Transcript_52741/m.171535 type:complete len:203 (-) Transcript_52741:543-1151(-)